MATENTLFNISDEIKYQQQYQHFSKMNDLLYKLPVIFSAAIGGFWYFGYSIKGDDPVLAMAIYIFSGVFSLCCFQVMNRFGLAFNKYIKNINKMDGALAISIKDDNSPSVLTIIKVILVISALLSGFVAHYVYLKQNERSGITISCKKNGDCEMYIQTKNEGDVSASRNLHHSPSIVMTVM